MSNQFVCKECMFPCYLRTGYGELTPYNCPYDNTNHTLWEVED